MRISLVDLKTVGICFFKIVIARSLILVIQPVCCRQQLNFNVKMLSLEGYLLPYSEISEREREREREWKTVYLQPLNGQAITINVIFKMCHWMFAQRRTQTVVAINLLDSRRVFSGWLRLIAPGNCLNVFPLSVVNAIIVFSNGYGRWFWELRFRCRSALTSGVLIQITIHNIASFPRLNLDLSFRNVSCVSD